MLQQSNIDLSADALLITERDEYGLTALHYAAKFNNVNAIDFFIKHNAGKLKTIPVIHLRLWDKDRFGYRLNKYHETTT